MAENHFPHIFPGLRPEMELLLAAVRCMQRGATAAMIPPGVFGSVDWAYLLGLAEYHGVSPILYKYLEKLRWELVPTHVSASLREAYVKTGLRNQLLTSELVDILDLFGRHGISVLPYKGPILAHLFYKNVALRPCVDLDIFVRKKDVLIAKHLLMNEGYRTERTFTPKEERRYLERDCEYHLRSRDGRISLEIHWDVLPRHSSSGLDPEFIWSRTVPIAFNGAEMLCLQPEELLVILCIHGGDKHSWSRLRFVCDIACTMGAAQDLDWERAMRNAESLGRRKTVLVGLGLAHIVTGVRIPETLFENIFGSGSIKARIALLGGRLLGEGEGLPGFSRWFSFMNFLHARQYDGRRSDGKTLGVLSYVRAVLGADFADRSALPFFLWNYPFLSHLFRPVRLYMRNGMSLFGRLR